MTSPRPRPVRGALFKLAFNLLTFAASAGAVASLPFGRAGVVGSIRLWSRGHRWLARILLGQRLVIEGDFSDRPVLYVLKHESPFETVVLPGVLAFPAVFAKAELFRIPVFGAASRAYGLIPLDRDGGAKALRQMVGAAKAALADGRPLCLFPEGTRISPGEAPPLKPGFLALYTMLKVPMVPVAVASGALHPPKGLGFRPGVIRFVVGEAIPPGLPRDEAEALVHAAINALQPTPVGDVPRGTSPDMVA